MFGSALHVLVDESLAIDALLRQIAPDDPAAEARPITPTLEDVFVIMSRAEEGREAAA